MQTLTDPSNPRPIPYRLNEDEYIGGDQSPLNDADADEDRDPEAELDLGDLRLDEFADDDKLDVGSSTLT